MFLSSISTILQRDLNKLKQEIELYNHEPSIWMIEKSVANSAGNLCLHLVGNLKTFIGAQLGNTGYIRNRELEFSQKDIPKEELLNKIEGTIKEVTDTLNSLNEDILNQEYPLVVLGEKTTTGYFLIHLCAHLSYHLGQINYHRRLLDQ